MENKDHSNTQVGLDFENIFENMKKSEAENHFSMHKYNQGY